MGLIILALALLTLRITLWRYFVNSDLQNAFLPWQTYLLEHGRWHALQHPFSMYFPAYFDLTAMTSYLDGHINRISQIKLLSFVFDIVTPSSPITWYAASPQAQHPAVGDPSHNSSPPSAFSPAPPSW